MAHGGEEYVPSDLLLLLLLLLSEQCLPILSADSSENISGEYSLVLIDVGERVTNSS
jgi:hypothetical protein